MVTVGLPYSTKVTCFASLISNLEQSLGCSSNLHLSSLPFDYTENKVSGLALTQRADLE